MSLASNIAAPIRPRPLVAVLGAGRARRFGADKLSQPCAGKPLGRWALDAALDLGEPLLWVAGATVPDFIAGDCAVVQNLQAEAGMGTSVALAAQIAAERGADALLVLLADMPLVTGALLARLIAVGAPVACRHHDCRPGVPALLPAASFAALQALTGDRGAGPILRALPGQTLLAGLTLLDCAPIELLDVDSPADLAIARAALNHQA